MDCTNINTPAEILNAFRACNNPDEEIALFECLATRLDPPVVAFFELLQKIKLEPVLALTIQAFGKISNPDIKARLKESTDLLEMLSYQAQSGSSDLIKWSAATAIEQIGFDFLMVAQYVTQDPRKIAEKIVQSKSQSIVDTNSLKNDDYFIYYGPLFLYDVIVEEVPVVQKITILKVVRELSGFGLKEAKDWVESVPKVIKKNIFKEAAEKTKKQLEEAGAKVSIRPVSKQG